MPADYLNDLIQKAKKTTGKDPVSNIDADQGIPPASAGGDDLESKLQDQINKLQAEKQRETVIPKAAPEPVAKPAPIAPAPKPIPKEAPSMDPFAAIKGDSSTAGSADISGADDFFGSGSEPAEIPAAQPEIPAATQADPGGFGIPATPSAESMAGTPEIAPDSESEVEKKIFNSSEKIEVESYGNVKIYKVPGEKLLYYYVPVTRPTGSEKRIVRTIKEAATRLITISPYKIRDPEQRRSVYRQRIMDILQSSPEIKIPKGKMSFYTEAVIREMVGYGLIDPLVSDDKLEEIMVTGSKKPVYVFHRDYDMMKTNIEFYTDDEVVDLINKMGREVGRRVDYSSPLLDARLVDGSRVNATIKPASISGPTITIRKFKADPFSIIDLINFGTFTSEVAAFLWLAVEGLDTRPANILISGGTGSGKTTTLNVLASFIPPTERVITIEDTAELNLPLEHWIRMESKPPGLEHRGELTLDILTKNSLRMRPDRIIVGEIRHDEAFTLFTAMNTGHDGSIGTVHANSAQETIVRVTNPPMNVPQTMLSGLNFIIVEQRLHDRKKGTIRRLTEISEVGGVLEGKPSVQAIFEWDPVKDTMKKTGVPSNYLRILAKLAGMTNAQIDREIKKRQAFLEDLKKKNIRSIEDTSRQMLLFLLQENEK